jgi:hypothetical protein
LRQFTKIPFRQIVSDDGTRDPDVQRRQREVVEAHGAVWIEQPGPTYGISYNLNWMFEQAGTPWVFLIEDACRPSMGWLETALDALERVGLKEWGGKKVGALGMTSSYENWHLACAKALPCQLYLDAFFDKKNQTIYDIFWGSAVFPHWNDGWWCWQRMHQGCLESCQDHQADGWPEIIRTTWRDPILRHEVGDMRWEEVQGTWGYQSHSGWPRTRRATWAMGPSAWGLYNVEAWRDVGRFRDGCTFYEGHLGVRLAKHGWLSINCECPPWLHQSGLAFHVRDNQKEPRWHAKLDGPGGILDMDFGCPGGERTHGYDHVDMGRLARSYFKEGEIDAICKELSAIDPLYAVPGWERWM